MTRWTSQGSSDIRDSNASRSTLYAWVLPIGRKVAVCGRPLMKHVEVETAEGNLSLRCFSVRDELVVLLPDG